MEIISGVRTIRKDKNIPFKDAIELMAINNDNVSTYFDSIVSKLGNISSLQYVTEKSRWSLVLPCKFKRIFPITGNINVEEEIKLTAELNYTKGFLKSVQGKLSNEKFVNGAPEKVLANERQKESDALAKLKQLSKV
jgi:valyl-tRNA synthetase